MYPAFVLLFIVCCAALLYALFAMQQGKRQTSEVRLQQYFNRPFSPRRGDVFIERKMKVLPRLHRSPVFIEKIIAICLNSVGAACSSLLNTWLLRSQRSYYFVFFYKHVAPNGALGATDKKPKMNFLHREFLSRSPTRFRGNASFTLHLSQYFPFTK